MTHMEGRRGRGKKGEPYLEDFEVGASHRERGYTLERQWLYAWALMSSDAVFKTRFGISQTRQDRFASPSNPCRL